MDTSHSISSNHHLRQERMRRNWRQQDLADLLGTTPVTVSRWEGGSQHPGPYFREKLCALFSKSPEELGLVTTLQPVPVSSERTLVWNVPFPRNPFFTGRDRILEHLHMVLLNEQTLAARTQAYSLHGLGGIGKTQLAIEYAYQHYDEYDAVLWVEAETQTSLISSFVALARLLALPEQAEDDQNKVVAAVLRWLNGHQGWLLILDNVEDLSMITPFLPASDRGALLFTTRLQTLGTRAQRIELPLMTVQEGCDFLLARINHLCQGKEHQSLDPQEIVAAQQIVAQMGGLPLALEQAGAYIEATKCSLSDYLRFFQMASQRLLDEHEDSSDHPLSVSRTFMLTFERFEQRYPPAAELLLICAFLAPDAIPEMFFQEGASSLGATFEALATDRLAFEKTLKVLLSYSLIWRDASTHTISIHRLVQMVLKGRLSSADWRSRAERVTRTVTRLFPFNEDMQTDHWQTCERLLPHALVCLRHSEYENDLERLALPLLNQVATYLTRRARYCEAEPLFIRAIQIGKGISASQRSLLAEALRGLGMLYIEQGKYEQAEPLLKQALSIAEQTLDSHHPHLAPTLNNLGELYRQQGKDKQAEPLFERALHIREQTLGHNHPQIASSLTNLGILYGEQGKYEQAEPLFERALHIWEQTLGPDHPYLATALSNLGEIYRQQGKYEQAESLLTQALRLWEQTLGPDHLQIAQALDSLGMLYGEQGKYEQAELLLERALRILERSLGHDHAYLAFPLISLGDIFIKQGKYEQARAVYQQALRVQERRLGPSHPKTMRTKNTLHTVGGRMQDAEQAVFRNGGMTESRNVLLCACGCGREIDMSKSRGEPRRFVSNACKQRFYRNASRQKRNTH